MSIVAVPMGAINPSPSQVPNYGPNFVHWPSFIPNGWTIGVIFQFHILVVAFIMGTAVIIGCTGFIPLRRQVVPYERFTYTLTHWLEETFSFGATLAVFGLVLIYGLFPRYFVHILTVFFAPTVAIFCLWLIMILTLVGYYYLWERLRPQRRMLHQSLIVLYALAETAFIIMITLYTQYQIAPQSASNSLVATYLPVWVPEMLHRIIGNISYAGFLIGAWGAWRAYRKRRLGSAEERAYYHWVAHFGFLWGIIFEFAQPLVGYFYVLGLSSGSPQVYNAMMLGYGQWAWELQIALVGATFALSDLYMLLSIRRNIRLRRSAAAVEQIRVGAGLAALAADTRRSGFVRDAFVQSAAELGIAAPERPIDRTAELWANLALALVILLAAIAIIPSQIPVIGSMTTKYGCLIGFVFLTLVSLVFYWRDSRRMFWGTMGLGQQGILMLLGVVLIIIMIVMGGIRYTKPLTGCIDGVNPSLCPPAYTHGQMQLPQLTVQPIH
jgi:cytochrome bd-type quinol oxidase subunit 1